MTDSNVNIIIRTIAENEGVSKTKKAYDDLTKTLTKAAGVATGVAVTLNKAFDWGKQGAQVGVLSKSFERMGGDLVALQKASKGTISDFDLMNATNTLLIGTSGQLREEFLKNSDQLLAIAKAANTLNPALGDTTFLYESIARGIKRNSPLILDNLGLTIKIGEANQRYADELGKTVDELSAAEQQQALLNDVLRAGGELMEEAAGIDTSDLDAIAQMETAFANLGNTIKQQLAPYLAKAATGIKDIITWQAQFDDGIKMIEQQSDSYEQYVGLIEQVSGELGRAIFTQEEYNHMMSLGGKEAAIAENSIVMLSEAEWVHNKTLIEGRDAMYEYVKVMGYANDGMEGLANKTEDSAEAAKDAEQAYEDMWGAANKDWGGVFGDFADNARFIAGGGLAFENFGLSLDQIGIKLADAGSAAVADFQPKIEQAALNAQIAFIKFQQEIGELDLWEARDQLVDVGLTARDAYNTAKDDTYDWSRELENANFLILSIISSLDMLDGKKARAVVDVDVNSQLPSIGGYTPQATGGPLSPLALVGEQGPELVINGVVVPASMTRQLMALGLRPRTGYANGGPLMEAGAEGFLTPEQVYTTYYLPGQTTGGGGGGGNQSTADKENKEMKAVQAAAVQYGMQIQFDTVTQKTASEIRKSNQNVVDRLDELIDTVLTEDGAGRAFRQAIRTNG